MTARADWRVQLSTDAITDREEKIAEVHNQRGYRFGVYRVEGGQVFAVFALKILDELHMLGIGARWIVREACRDLTMVRAHDVKKLLRNHAIAAEEPLIHTHFPHLLEDQRRFCGVTIRNHGIGVQRFDAFQLRREYRISLLI